MGEHAQALGNSDRIQLKFGNYGIEVLENSPGIRVSNLYSVQDGVKTNRTFAIVTYPNDIEPAIRKEHEAIIGGQSIGIVFKANGWLIDKRHQYFGELEASPDDPGIVSVFGEIGTSRPAIHVYSLWVTKHDSEFEYASITEVHHPEYLKLEDLKTIYGSEFDGKLKKSGAVSDFLKVVKSRMKAT